MNHVINLKIWKKGEKWTGIPLEFVRLSIPMVIKFIFQVSWCVGNKKYPVAAAEFTLSSWYYLIDFWIFINIYNMHASFLQEHETQNVKKMLRRSPASPSHVVKKTHNSKIPTLLERSFICWFCGLRLNVSLLKVREMSAKNSISRLSFNVLRILM